MSSRAQAGTIRFNANLSAIGGRTILRLPEKASRALPSRGQVAVHGTINGHEFQTVVEPDGSFGHWIKVNRTLQGLAAARAGDAVTVEIQPAKVWPEPQVPQDLKSSLAAAPQKIQEMWKDITPMSRWEWVRWVNETRNTDTRKRRVEVTISKMQSGKRRPCCFDLAACTDPDLSRNGRLVQG